MTKDELAHKLTLQSAVQDGAYEVIFSISPSEKELLKTFTIAELKAIPDFGAKKAKITVIGEEDG